MFVDQRRLFALLLVVILLAVSSLQGSAAALADGQSDSPTGASPNQSTTGNKPGDSTKQADTSQNDNTNVDQLAANKPTPESTLLVKLLYGALFAITGLTGLLVYLRMRDGMRT